MKYRIYLISALSFIIFSGITSCKKSFLDVPVTQKIVAEDYVTNLTTAQEYLNGIYFSLARDVYDYVNVSYADVAADNTKVLGTLLTSHYSWNMSGSESPQNAENLNTLWLKGYAVIRSCNFLLEKINQLAADDPAIADAIKGQAYALRALVHHEIVNVFAQPFRFSTDGSHPGIPYDTTFDREGQVVRQSVNDVYTHIIADLSNALKLIPSSLTGQSILNLNSVKAILARVYLFKDDILNAKSLAREISSLVPIMPTPDYPGKLFTSADKESLFWLPPTQSSNAGAATFQGYLFSFTTFLSATTDIVNIIKERPNDVRKNWFNFTSNIWQIKKFPQSAVAGVSTAGTAYYETIIRASEMYITAAECYARIGKEDSARYYLDALRKRADNSISPSMASGPALLDSIYKERRKELCFENLRMFDLLRLGKGVSRGDVLSPSPANLPYPSNKAIAPIPEIDVRTYDWNQNPGYE